MSVNQPYDSVARGNRESSTIGKDGSISYGAVQGEAPADHDERDRYPPFSGLSIVLFCVFVGDMARGVTFPTMWMYVKYLGGNKVSQGFAVASFSAGRILSSPILGSLSESYGYRVILLISSVVVFVGCLTYAFSTSVSMLLAAQIIIGVGSGTLGVTRSYVAENTTRKNRSELMAYLTAVQYMGFTVTPIIGSLLSFWGNECQRRAAETLYGDSSMSAGRMEVISINEFSAPALFMGLMAALSAFLFAVAFNEKSQLPPASNSEEEVELLRRNNASRTSTAHSELTSNSEGETDATVWRDRLIIGGCILNGLVKGSIGVYETVGADYGSSNIALTRVEIGYTFSSLGACGVIALLLYPSLLLRCTEIQLVIGGVVIMIASCLLFCSMHFTGGLVSIFVLGVALMYAVGYPVGHTALLCLFAKIVRSGPQGTLLGWFGASGSLARVVFPLLAGVISEYVNDSVVFMLLTVVLLGCLSIMIVYHKTIDMYCS
mmetsp:Transcript_20804/g.29912  ORF Transcript_20804/g.29912 Transcript_20804/m.29912 type:complete len:491 (+) Transcript_20804:87-1559(+)